MCWYSLVGTTGSPHETPQTLETKPFSRALPEFRSQHDDNQMSMIIKIADPIKNDSIFGQLPGICKCGFVLLLKDFCDMGV